MSIFYDPPQGSPEGPKRLVFQSRALLWQPGGRGREQVQGVFSRAASRECSCTVLESSSPWKSLGSSHGEKQERPLLVEAQMGEVPAEVRRAGAQLQSGPDLHSLPCTARFFQWERGEQGPLAFITPSDENLLCEGLREIL